MGTQCPEQGSRGAGEQGSGESGRSSRGGKRAAADLNATAHTPAAHAIVEAYAKACRKRPPSSVLTELAVQVDGLLAEDWSEPEITKAVQAWSDKGLHPKTLASVAHEVANRRANQARAAPAMHPTDAAVARLLDTERPALPGGSQ